MLCLVPPRGCSGQPHGHSVLTHSVGIVPLFYIPFSLASDAFPLPAKAPSLLQSLLIMGVGSALLALPLGLLGDRG